MPENDHRSTDDVPRVVTGALLTLIAVTALVLVLSLVVGVGMLRLSRMQTAADSARKAKAVTAGASTRLPQEVGGRSRGSNSPQPQTMASTAKIGEPPADPLHLLPAPAQARASLLRVDDDSAGGWVGRYGKRGYDVAMAGEPRSLPAGISLSMNGSQLYIWAALTTDRRGLSIPSDPPRLSAGQWFAWEHFSLDLDLRGRGQELQVALYLLDWDSDSRAQRLEVIDADTGAVLLARTDEHFHNGRYLLVRLSGHVLLRFTKTAGANCTLSGVFLDDLRAVP